MIRRRKDPITDEDIVNNPDLLTMYAAVREVLQPYDGLVGDVVGSDHFITSPNADRIFEPPIDDKREVILRKDGRYGPDDPFLWPQLYHINTFHLACVQSKVKDPTNAAFILWWTPKHADFVLDDRGAASGTGRISRQQREKLGAQVEEVYKYYETVKDNQLLYGTNDTNRQWVLSMVSELHQANHRMNQLAANFEDVVIMFSDVQRHCLELRAYIVYMIEIRPTISSTQPIVNPVRDFVGVITYSPNIVAECAYAGIRVWYIRPLSAFVKTVCIKSRVASLKPAQFLEMKPMFSPTEYIFKGASSDPRKYHAIIRHHRLYFAYRKKSSPLPSAESSSSDGKRTKVSKTTPDFAAEKFLDRKAPCYPPAIPSWIAGLNKVVKRRSLPAEYRFGDNGYAFPDPWMFFPADQLDLRLVTYFHMWLHYKPALILRSISDAKNMRLKAGEWRSLLFSEVLSSSKASSSSTSQPTSRGATELSKMEKLLKSWALQYGAIITSPKTAATWNGTPLSTTQLPGNQTWQEIVYELNELNFRWELRALDAEMVARPPHMTEEEFNDTYLPLRVLKISNCFPGWRDDVSGGDVTTVDYRRANIGLADADDKRRQRWVSALSALLSGWKDAPYMFKRDKDCSALGSKEYEELQVELARFYCQSFFDRYHRAPTIPRYIRTVASSPSSPT